MAYAVRRKDNSSNGVPDVITAHADSEADINRAITAGGANIATIKKRRLNSSTWELECEVSLLATPATIETAIKNALVVGNLSIDITADLATAAVGASVTFTITATNLAGGDAVDNVTVTVTIPAGWTMTANTPAGGTSYSAPTWTIGTLAAGASKVLTLVGDADTGTSGQTKTITVTITGTVTDSAPSNNTDSVNVLVS